MRFHGGSVGHSSSQAATDTFKNDHDELDIVLLQARKVQQTHSDMEVGDSVDTLVDDDGVFLDDGEEEMEGDVESPLSNGLTGGSHKLTGPWCIV